ncbi:MAG: hypoxanthine phosphoribosyltransferase [Marinilabiliaceae bacterium]|nr:hypoxanthine phosphoribosyltransferase [Marinilabiliaceae bacterium]
MKQIQLANKTFELSIPQSKIDSAIEFIANEMNNHLKNKDPLFLCILNGSFMFAADLIKKITFNCQISFVKLSSYEGTISTGNVKSIIGLNESIENRTVIILEDIIDTGITIDNIINQIKKLNPKEIKVASLFFKPTVCKSKNKFDYIGLEIPNDFVVGYGLDYKGYGRNLTDLYTVID